MRELKKYDEKPHFYHVICMDLFKEMRVEDLRKRQNHYKKLVIVNEQQDTYNS